MEEKIEKGTLFEIKLVKDACDDEGKKTLIQHITPLVEKITEHYTDYGVAKEELISIGWTYFDFALKKYEENIFTKKQEPYKFSIYFAWYVKTSIETYLSISSEPLDGIVPRKGL